MILSILLLLTFPPVFSFFYSQQNPYPQQSSKPMTIKHVDIADNSVLLESGKAAKLRATPSNGEIRIISYNIRWRSGDDLKELIKLFREDNEIGNPTILALQEVDRH